ncbi:MAG TPA: hypothetical protein ENN21_09255 [Spirochaetes bacterium]|nr:hypothetical protein [Spirochaetota bacterium]
MTFAELKMKTLGIVRAAREKLGVLWSLPYAKTYIITSITLTFLLVVVFFPYDVLIRQQIKRIEPSISRGIYLGDFNFRMFGDSSVDELDIILRDQSGVTARNLLFNFRYNPVTLLVNKNLKGNVSIQNLSYEKGETGFSAVLKSTMDLKLSSKPGPPLIGTVDLTLSNVLLKGIIFQGLNIAPIKFTVIETSVSIDGDELKIGRIIFSGTDLSGSVSGGIRLASLFANSALNLIIEIDTRSKLLEDYKLFLSFLPRPTGNRLVIPVTGTIANPGIKTQQANPAEAR